MHPFARSVADFAHQSALFCTLAGKDGDGARVLVALSGGPDSVALLLALHEAERANALGDARLAGAAHFHHGLRGLDADADAAFAAASCARVGLPCLIGLGAVGAFRAAARHRPSPNDAARSARYEFLREAAREMNATHVATAHTSDDQAETVLLRVLRGTTPDGLAAIPARRVLCAGGDDGENVTLVRPLLEQSRAAVEAYLADQGVNARRDPSNDDLRYARSRVRRLLPRLACEAQNPRLNDALNRLARAAALDKDLLDRLADDLWHASATLAPRRVTLDAPVLRAAHPALCRRVLLRVLRHAAGDNRIEDAASMAAVNALDAILLSPLPKGGPVALDLPGGVRALWTGAACLTVEVRAKASLTPPAAYAYPLPMPGAVWVAPARLWVRSTLLPTGDAAAQTALIAAGRRPLAVTLALPEAARGYDRMNVGGAKSRPFLEVRAPHAGERFAPLGMAGQTRPVRDMLADAGWPRALRETAPVVARCDTGEILWIVGLAQSESSRVEAAAFAAPSSSSSPRPLLLLRLTAYPDC